MEIVMLVSWAIWTTRNDFIIKASSSRLLDIKA
jgi:hypothetical protein